MVAGCQVKLHAVLPEIMFLASCYLHSRGISHSSLDHHPLPEEADGDQTHQRYLHDLCEAVSAHNR